jgi:hypothetical protein
VSFNHLYTYIDDVLLHVVNKNNFHNYVYLIYPNELEIKRNTTESDISPLYLDILLMWHWLKWQNDNCIIWQTWWLYLCNRQVSFSM